jgi:hypothetical protein
MTNRNPIRLSEIPSNFAEQTSQIVEQAIHEMLRGISEAAAESVRTLTGSWQAHQTRLAEILRNLDETIREAEPDVRLLGRSGWTLPMWMPLQAIPKIVAAVGRESPDQKQLDRAFVEHYTKEDDAKLRELFATLISEPALEPWRNLLDESFLCYHEQKYQVVVPALFIVLEGLSITVAEAPAEKSPVMPMRKKARLVRSGITFLACVSLDEFLGATFASRSFAYGEPPTLNRHWIIHGRSRRIVTQTDCIKLFNALHTLSNA